MHYEMADANDPEALIRATQKASIQAMRNTLAKLRADMPGAPGLTWPQIGEFLDFCESVKPTIHTQENVL